ncbi:MBL fold metallo-hydrolase RNA specificity domain-containing protein [Marinobacter manganoxydans]|uniref:Beta-lactamase domain-containing protein n=1 Tax=Marinobacter manganoxydans MnI7-9 TaxID=1094979 RepID=G6YP74_9GAMM|nr:MBL fold metallo-hydrolase [Marinobacter manganoxydans]EHJ06136.1 beta-lactamase domain-containing protein [Marinobacter manganoxydans MnI7-9]MTI76229.1 MBL fold metallo-hydrolase [Marinobacter sp.]
MISISHHGATSGVTGSCHELTVGHAAEKSGILIDCGLFQGQDEGRGASASDLSIDFPIDHIRALVVTHVHIDHVGRIPYLLAAGFDGPIICSEPSAIMLPEILEDALKIGFTRDRQLIELVLGVIRSRLVPVPYGQWHSVFAGDDCSLSVRLQRAGHILGSAYVECDARAGESEERVVFSGDLGAPHAPLLPAPQSPERADRLVIESTYGDKDHEDREMRRYRLKAVLEHALEDGGTVLVPAFSIGRTQELLYEIEGLINEFGGELWSNLEIVVDSPLAAEFTRIYRDLKPYWDAEATDLVRQGRHPLSFEQLTVINFHEDHLNAVDYLARSHRACVVLAGSGMCAGGRVVNYLKAMLGDKRNDVLFVGYQAAGTPGRDILTYGPRGGWVELDGERYDIRARVHQVGGYSAHAGQSDLVAFVSGIPVPPREIRIVHGDPGAKLALKRCFQSLTGTDIIIPSE